jgi:energy-coupling factor transporter ATP-binding protein EcfA2
MIELDHVTKRYGDTVAVDDVTFTIQPGVVTGFLGPNGAGKSTTMRLMVGLDAPSSGDVRVNGMHYQLAQLAIGVLGVLVITGEHSTGMIRSTFMAVPKRLPVIWAKLAVFCSVTFVLMLAASFVAFLATQPILQQHGLDKTLGDPHALRAVIGAALYLTVIGALGVGLGTLVRNTAGGIAAFVGILFVLPGITALLPHATAESVNRFLPLNAGSAVLTSTFESFHHHLSPWAGFAVFCLYVAVTIAVAAIALVRRDA